MTTELGYKGFKLITYKEKRGGYTTYVFDGGIKSIGKYHAYYKKHAIGMAQSACDYNDFGGGR